MTNILHDTAFYSSEDAATQPLEDTATQSSEDAARKAEERKTMLNLMVAVGFTGLILLLFILYIMLRTRAQNSKASKHYVEMADRRSTRISRRQKRLRKQKAASSRESSNRTSNRSSTKPVAEKPPAVPPDASSPH